MKPEDFATLTDEELAERLKDVKAIIPPWKRLALQRLKVKKAKYKVGDVVILADKQEAEILQVLTPDYEQESHVYETSLGQILERDVKRKKAKRKVKNESV